jgi:hypothetical protein
MILLGFYWDFIGILLEIVVGMGLWCFLLVVGVGRDPYYRRGTQEVD